MELDERKLRILAAIVETYTATGEPVGSKRVAELLGGEVSSATVRNEMAELFEMGLLEQPHTSAGRVPSHLGYRVYLNQIMRVVPPTGSQKQEIEALFNRHNPDPDRLLQDAATALAGYTNCAVVSTTLTRQSLSVRSIALVPVSDRTVVILLVASNGMVRSKVCRVDFTLTPKIVDFFTRFANGRIAGRSLAEVTSGYISSIAFSLGEYTDVFSPLLMAIYELCRETNDGQIYRSGASNLLEYEELRRIANHLFRLFNSREDVMSLIAQGGSGITVSIGKENPRLELRDSAVIISKYRIGADSTGAIGLIGPIRMDYAELIPRLQYFSDLLGRLISETLDNSKEGEPESVQREKT